MSELSPQDWVKSYYADKLERYGHCAKGVDWSSHRDMNKRFELLATVSQTVNAALLDDPDLIILDYGSGLAHLYEWLTAQGYVGTYIAYDLVDSSLTASRARFSHCVNFTSTNCLSTIDNVNVVWASGVFNVKGDMDSDEWVNGLVVPSLREMLALEPDVLAVNFLRNDTQFPERRSDLYHTNPTEIRTLLTELLNHHASLAPNSIKFREDYGLNEFTVAARLRSA